MKDNKSQLEAIARESVQRNGLKSLSFRTLADEIGIKSSSVHYYFPEKSDLAKVLIERDKEDLFNLLYAIEKQPGTFKKKLASFINIFEKFAKNNQLSLCGMLAAEVEHLSDHNKALLASTFTEVESWLTQLIEANRVEINSTLTSMQLARATLSGVQGALLVDRVMGNTRRLKAQKEIILAQVV